MKICSKCKISKENQLFGHSTRNIDGLMSECKKCHNAYKTRYREKNPDVSEKSNQNFYKNHREQILESNKKWRQDNPEKYRESKRKTNIKNSIESKIKIL